jgi:hypothetical protein
MIAAARRLPLLTDVAANTAGHATTIYIRIGD